jgi:hypothetical protein
VMLVVPLLNSSICYFSFTLFMCFFRFPKWKRILHRYGNADTALFESMNSLDLTHFSLLPKICSHRSSKRCQLGFSGIMSVSVSSTSHFHSSATSSPADAACNGIHQIFFTITSQLNSLEACCVTNNLALPPIAVTNFLHRLQREHPLYPRRQLPRIQEGLAHCLYGIKDCLTHCLCSWCRPSWWLHQHAQPGHCLP